MQHRLVEIAYDIGGIPGCNPHAALCPRAVRFRDEAGGMIGDALDLLGLGSLIDCGAGPGEVTLRFEVSDFDAAEDAILAAVAGTPQAGFREILRYWDQVMVA